MEPVLNPAQEVQAVGRIHRMGQTKPVTVTHLVMGDSSVEQRIEEMHVRCNLFMADLGV
jgi:E3 ubiquitin-protein ligase SHPRH